MIYKRDNDQICSKDIIGKSRGIIFRFFFLNYLYLALSKEIWVFT